MFLRRLPASRIRSLATGVALGVLATILIVQLGLFDIMGLHKIEPILCISIAVGLVLGYFDRLGIAVAVTSVMVAVFLLVAFTPLIDGTVEGWVRDDSASATPLDAVVVLSGYVKPDSALESVGLERLLTGLELVKSGVAPRLITTRVIADIDGRRISSDEGQRRLIRLANLESTWSEVDSVSNTHEEATRVAALLGSRATHSVAVVTSPQHTRRACAVFEGVGLRVVCVPAHESLHMTWHPDSWTDRLAAFHDYMYERLGMVKYRFNGWISSPN